MKTSDLFMDIVTDLHGGQGDCEFCKRTHFTRNDDDVDSLREKAKAQPDKYLESDDDSIAWGYLDGRQYVWRCPCDSGHRYEEFIWRHRNLIAEYLKKRAEHQAKNANEDLETVKDLI